jgi:deoxyribonuclease V
LIACLDVDYRDDHAMAACLLAPGWDAAAATEQLVERVTDVSPYVPGRFFERELPCLQAVLARVRDPLTAVIVDGYVWLDEAGRPGLGAHLWEALGRAAPVVGVAKTTFRGSGFAQPVHRGRARRPLWVTAAGIDVRDAAARVGSMHGPHRLPTLLAEVDRLCRRGRG